MHVKSHANYIFFREHADEEDGEGEQDEEQDDYAFGGIVVERDVGDGRR